MQGHFQMLYPYPCIAIIAITEVQEVKFMIQNIDLGASFLLEFWSFEGGGDRRERRWSDSKIGGNLASEMNKDTLLDISLLSLDSQALCMQQSLSLE